MVALIISLPDCYCSLTASLKIPSPTVTTEILSLICHCLLYPANSPLTPPPWKDLAHTVSCRGSQCLKGSYRILSSCRLTTRNTGKCSEYTSALDLECSAHANPHATTVILEESCSSEQLLSEKPPVCPRQWGEGRWHTNLQSLNCHFFHYSGWCSGTGWSSDRLMQRRALGH